MKKGLKKILIIAAVLAIAVMLAAPSMVFADSHLSTIVETAIADGRFTTLVAAVGAAGLVDTLNSPGPFTVFAPTDDAFAKLPAGTIDALLADPSGALTDILLYHGRPDEDRHRQINCVGPARQEPGQQGRQRGGYLRQLGA